MARRPTRAALDEIASTEEQNAWLTSQVAYDLSPLRDHPKLGDDPYDDRLRLLFNAPEWPDFAAFLRAYIELTIFRPFQTEQRWWNITIGERGSYAHINIWRQLALEIDFRADPADNEIKANGVAYIDAQRSVYKLASCFEIQPATYKGKPLTGNKRSQVALRIAGAPLGQLDELFNSDWMLTATRTLNLDLMRGGQLAFGWSHHHVAKFVDAIFAEDFTPRGENAEEGHSPTVENEPASPDVLVQREDWEIQRLAWLRKNQARFSVPVKAHWGGRCAVTGIEEPALLQACHIRPFSDSEESPAERGDPYNGIYLAAHVHAAFDALLIGITPDGEVCLSDRLCQDDRQRMNLRDGVRIPVSERHRPYLEYRYAKFREANKR